MNFGIIDSQAFERYCYESDRKRQFDYMYLAIAKNVATMSFATRLKVGAIIVKDGNIISMGFNGMPYGFPNEDIEFINEAGELQTNPLACHGEFNAIVKAAASTYDISGATLYQTISPCMECVKPILQSKIKRVVFEEYYRIRDSIDILTKAGVEMVKLDRK